jgi:hypothetical protein
MRALWSLYRSGRTVGDGVSVTAKDLWNSIRHAKPKHFSEWWRSFVAGKPGRVIGQYGMVLAAEGIASAPISPQAGSVLSANSDQEFVWELANYCAHPDKGQYSLRIYGTDLTTPKFSSPFSPHTRHVVKADDLRKLVKGDGRLYWAVVARDLTEPPTGEYHGPFAEIRLRAD